MRLGCVDLIGNVPDRRVYPVSGECTFSSIFLLLPKFCWFEFIEKFVSQSFECSMLTFGWKDFDSNLVITKKKGYKCSSCLGLHIEVQHRVGWSTSWTRCLLRCEWGRNPSVNNLLSSFLVQELHDLVMMDWRSQLVKNDSCNYSHILKEVPFHPRILPFYLVLIWYLYAILNLLKNMSVGNCPTI